MEERKFLLFLFIVTLLFTACTPDETAKGPAPEQIRDFLDSLDFVSVAVCNDVMEKSVGGNIKAASEICASELSNMMVAMDGWPGKDCDGSIHSCARDDVNHLAFEIVYAIGEYNSNAKDKVTFDGWDVNPSNSTGTSCREAIVKGLNDWAAEWERNGIITPVPSQ